MEGQWMEEVQSLLRTRIGYKDTQRVFSILELGGYRIVPARHMVLDVSPENRAKIVELIQDMEED